MMSTTTARREAKLKTECAGRHPTLPVHMWTSAASLANLVASDAPALEEEIRTGRTLQDTDFEFRGGRRRGLAGWITRTRSGEAALGALDWYEPLSGKLSSPRQAQGRL
jgi:hypothetical protein